MSGLIYWERCESSLEVRQSILVRQNDLSSLIQKVAEWQKPAGRGWVEVWFYKSNFILCNVRFSTIQFAEHLWHCDPPFIKVSVSM